MEFGGGKQTLHKQIQRNMCWPGPSRTHCQETSSRKINQGSSKETREKSSALSLQLREMGWWPKDGNVLQVKNAYAQNKGQGVA